MSLIGNAPCYRCGRHIHDIPLTGVREPDGSGGWNFEVAAGGKCLECGEPLRWMHMPSPQELSFDVRQIEKVNRGR
jgi:MOSC domain-containing protein YiiM